MKLKILCFDKFLLKLFISVYKVEGLNENFNKKGFIFLKNPQKKSWMGYKFNKFFSQIWSVSGVSKFMLFNFLNIITIKLYK